MAHGGHRFVPDTGPQDTGHRTRRTSRNVYFIFLMMRLNNPVWPVLGLLITIYFSLLFPFFFFHSAQHEDDPSSLVLLGNWPLVTDGASRMGCRRLHTLPVVAA